MNQYGNFFEAGLLMRLDGKFDLSEGAGLVDRHIAAAGFPVLERMTISKTEQELITDSFALLLYAKLPELREETDADGNLVEIEPEAPEIVIAMDVFAQDTDSETDTTQCDVVATAEKDALLAGIVNLLATRFEAEAVRWLDPSAIIPTADFRMALAVEETGDAFADIPEVETVPALDWAALAGVTLADVAQGKIQPEAASRAEVEKEKADAILVLDRPVRDEADLPMHLPWPAPEDTDREIDLPIHLQARPARGPWARLQRPLAHGAGLMATGLGILVLVNAPRMASALDEASRILP